MADLRLVTYVRTYLQQGYQEQQLKQHLVQSGWDARDVEEAFQVAKLHEADHAKPVTAHRQSGITHALAIVGIFLILGSVFYSYFFVVSPTFVEKPKLEKPLPPTIGQAISAEQVEYVLNELDVYKLHDSP